jgi:hypothetical protein
MSESNPHRPHPRGKAAARTRGDSRCARPARGVKTLTENLTGSAVARLGLTGGTTHATIWT